MGGGQPDDHLAAVFTFVKPAKDVAIIADIGVNDKFMKELGQTFTPGTSALFVLVRKATPDKVLEGLKKFKGTVIQTSLTKDKEEELRQVLEG